MRFYTIGLGCIDHLSASCIRRISIWRFPLYPLCGHFFGGLDVKDVGYVIVSDCIGVFDRLIDAVSELRFPK